MLPRELPISDEAVMAAHEAYHARLATQRVDETYVAMPAAIRAWLAAEGFEVETRLTHYDEDRSEERLAGPSESRRLQAVVDFLDAWRYCPVSSSPNPSRQCLESTAQQLLDALDDTARLISPWKPAPSSTEGGEG